MSAIAGIFHFNNAPINVEHGRRLMKELEKFPADDVQAWHSDNIFLGCHAQWITPESIGEKLPYYDQTRKLAITADAIIDNRDELCERLQVKNSLRKTITDSELIVLSYSKWGEESPKFLVGDFAFMIWDGRKNKLFGARDFSGSRTLYYYHNQGGFAFCTIIEPLLTLPYIEKKLNEDWLAEFLVLPGMNEAVNTIRTPYLAIDQLSPSHSMTVQDGVIKFKRYSYIKGGEKLRLKSNEEYEEAFREVFQTSVRARLRTHHRVGSQLSGGLDSGCVVGFAANELSKENKQLNTYSYIPEEDFVDWTPKHRLADERPLIQSTVQFVGNIKDYYLDFQGKSPLSEITDWLEIMEMPYKFFENSFWIKGIYEEARKHGIGILLNGARGNFSISWGPALDYYAGLLKKLNLFRLYHELKLYSHNIGVGKSRISSIVFKKAFPFFNTLFPYNQPYQFPLVINPTFAERTNIFDKIPTSEIDITTSNKFSKKDIREEHYGNLFQWNATGTSSTKLSLRYSLWNRDPTNDIRVIKFCLALPEEQFVQNGWDRCLIRRSTVNLLPDRVRLNQNIRGIQGADWLHRMIPSWDLFVQELKELSTDSLVTEFLNIPIIKDAIEKYYKRPMPQNAFDQEIRLLMRSLIVYRFLKNMA